MNPHSKHPLEPWVELSTTRWFRTFSAEDDVWMEIREVVETHSRNGDLDYVGIGPILKVNGRVDDRKKAKATWLMPDLVAPEIRAELARRRALLESHHGRTAELRTLPVAAVPVGAVVSGVIHRYVEVDGAADHPHAIVVKHVESSTPRSGFVTWTCGTCGEQVAEHAADRAEIVSLP